MCEIKDTIVVDLPFRHLTEVDAFSKRTPLIF